MAAAKIRDLLRLRVAFLAVLLLGVMSTRGRARNCGLGGLKAQTISCVLTTRLSSMYVPIVPLALIFVAFGSKETDDKF
jgi:hypothetical protein